MGVQHGLIIVRTTESTTTGGIRFSGVVPVIRQEYRVFSRGQKLVIRKRSMGVCKYNTNYIVPPRTEQLLGQGAPEAYHNIVAQAIAASVAEKTKSSYNTALNMLAACQASMVGLRGARIFITNDFLGGSFKGKYYLTSFQTNIHDELSYQFLNDYCQMSLTVG